MAGAAAGVAVLWVCLCKLDLDELLATTAQLACVVGVAAACDIVRDDAGLIAAIVMGLAVANLRAFHVPAKRPFFETLVQLIIGVLFVSISATVTPASLQHLVLPTIALVAVLVLVTRPLVAFLATIRTELTRGNARSPAGWRRAASSPRPPPRPSGPRWPPATSAARPRSCPSPSWSSSPPSPCTA